MLKRGLTAAKFAGQFLPRFNRRLRLTPVNALMEIFDILRYVAALLLVLALIGGAGLVARKWGVPGVTRAIADKRLSVVETLMIGPRQKLLIVRRDDAEHLIFTGPDGVCLIENIPSSSGLASGKPRA